MGKHLGSAPICNPMYDGVCREADFGLGTCDLTLQSRRDLRQLFLQKSVMRSRGTGPRSAMPRAEQCILLAAESRWGLPLLLKGHLIRNLLHRQGLEPPIPWAW